MAQIRNPGSIRLEGAPYGAGSGRDLFHCYYCPIKLPVRAVSCASLRAVVPGESPIRVACEHGPIRGWMLFP